MSIASHFSNVPDSARLWVFALARELSTEERALVTRQLDAFVGEWESHGTPVRGSFEILENRFVLVAGYVDDGVSGCSTDSMLRVMKRLHLENKIDGFDRTLVFFRDATGATSAVVRDEFQKLVEAGVVGDNTVVFDPTVQTVGDLRAGRFETTFARTWHATAFGR